MSCSFKKKKKVVNSIECCLFYYLIRNLNLILMKPKRMDCNIRPRSNNGNTKRSTPDEEYSSEVHRRAKTTKIKSEASLSLWPTHGTFLVVSNKNCLRGKEQQDGWVTDPRRPWNDILPSTLDQVSVYVSHISGNRSISEPFSSFLRLGHRPQRRPMASNASVGKRPKHRSGSLQTQINKFDFVWKGPAAGGYLFGFATRKPMSGLTQSTWSQPNLGIGHETIDPPSN